MLDEFEVNVDDDSGFEIAEQMVRMRRDCGKGDFAEVQALKQRWDATGGKGVAAGQFKGVERNEEDDETDASEDEDGDDMDVEMDEAPQLVTVKEKIGPEVDEEGFTKVTKKKR
jgi:pre-rRNA-processing protein TSR2